MPLLLAEGSKVGIHLDGPVSQIGCEIVERLQATGRPGKSNPDPARSSFAFGNKVACLVESNSLDGINRATGAREKNVEDGQRSAELHLPKIHLHVLSNE